MRSEAISPRSGRPFQQVFTEQEPETPWHLHLVSRESLSTCRETGEFAPSWYCPRDWLPRAAPWECQGSELSIMGQAGAQAASVPSGKNLIPGELPRGAGSRAGGFPSLTWATGVDGSTKTSWVGEPSWSGAGWAVSSEKGGKKHWEYWCEISANWEYWCEVSDLLAAERVRDI